RCAPDLRDRRIRRAWRAAWAPAATATGRAPRARTGRPSRGSVTPCHAWPRSYLRSLDVGFLESAHFAHHRAGGAHEPEGEHGAGALTEAHGKAQERRETERFEHPLMGRFGALVSCEEIGEHTRLP